MTHDERFSGARELVKAGNYEAARKLYDDRDALKSDARVIERRIEQHRAASQQSR